jgi:hypothetical protein
MTDWRDREELMNQLKMNDIDRIGSIEQWRLDHDWQEVDMYAAFILISIIGLFATLVVVKACQPVPAAAKPYIDISELKCGYCHQQATAPNTQKLTEYFRKAGSRDPVVMAHAVSKTSKPRLLAAVAVVETGGNYRVRRTGWKQKFDGGWQVNKKHWGKVPTDAYGQAAQADRILAELLEDQGSLKKALSVYGGDSTERYQRKVLAELGRVP